MLNEFTVCVTVCSLPNTSPGLLTCCGDVAGSGGADRHGLVSGRLLVQAEEEQDGETYAARTMNYECTMSSLVVQATDALVSGCSDGIGGYRFLWLR